jgi:hypothetical protein
VPEEEQVRTEGMALMGRWDSDNIMRVGRAGRAGGGQIRVRDTL